MHRRLLRLACAALVALVAGLLLPTGAPAATSCKSADLRYPFQPGGPKTFGVFKLRIDGGTCTKAHRVARAWMAEFELELLLGRVKLPNRVAGFRFTELPPTAAQTYNLRGRRGVTTLRFDYRVPNG
jgi:hypothetical protein